MHPLDRLVTYINENWPKFGGNPRDLDDLTMLYVVTSGLWGERGELVEHFKKFVRDGKPINREKVLLEFGDVLHYLVQLSLMFGFTIEEIVDANIAKLRARGHGAGNGSETGAGNYRRSGRSDSASFGTTPTK